MTERNTTMRRSIPTGIAMLVAFVAVMSSLIIVLAGGAQASTMSAPAVNTPTAHEAVASPNRPAPAEHSSAGGQLVAGPYYQLVAQHNNECLTTRSVNQAEQVVTRPCDGSTYQQWQARYVSGNYQIVNLYNGMCLDVANASQENWAHIEQVNCWGGANQNWRLAPAGANNYELVAQHSNKCLDIFWGWAIQYDCNNGSNQHFRFR